MVATMTTQRLGLVFILTAHMVFAASSLAEVIGFLGANITLEFTFNSSVDLSQAEHIVIHKFKDSRHERVFPGRGRVFENPRNKTVYWYNPELQMNDSGSYSASLLVPHGVRSESVILKVQEPSISSTVPPMSTEDPESSRSVGDSYVTILLLITPVVVFLVALPLLIWVLLGQKDTPPGQNSTPKETVQESAKASESSLVYSVLDFPLRSSAFIEVNPTDTEYAAVSYLPEMRPV